MFRIKFKFNDIKLIIIIKLILSHNKIFIKLKLMYLFIKKKSFENNN
jgi:hypothetical protein